MLCLFATVTAFVRIFAPIYWIGAHIKNKNDKIDH